MTVKYRVFLFSKPALLWLIVLYSLLFQQPAASTDATVPVAPAVSGNPTVSIV